MSNNINCILCSTIYFNYETNYSNADLSSFNLPLPIKSENLLSELNFNASSSSNINFSCECLNSINFSSASNELF